MREKVACGIKSGVFDRHILHSHHHYVKTLISLLPFSSQHKGQATTLEGESTGLDLTHSLVIIGFVIGFSIVFAVGLLYTKVFRMKRFKLLDNRGNS